MLMHSSSRELGFKCYQDMFVHFLYLLVILGAGAPQLLKVGDTLSDYLKGNTMTMTIIPRNLEFPIDLNVCLWTGKPPTDRARTCRLHTGRPKPGGHLAQSNSANQEDGDLCWSC